jgi:hypothetical protein
VKWVGNHEINLTEIVKMPSMTRAPHFLPRQTKVAPYYHDFAISRVPASRGEQANEPNRPLMPFHRQLPAQRRLSWAAEAFYNPFNTALEAVVSLIRHLGAQPILGAVALSACECPNINLDF